MEKEELLKTIDALRRERDYLSAILDTVKDGIYIVDDQFNLRYANPMVEKDFGPWKGRKCYAYFEDREDACPECNSLQVLKGKTVRSKWHARRKGRTYELLASPIKTPDGRIFKLDIMRDITKEQEAEETKGRIEKKLKESHKMESLGLMAGGIAHDFNNKLMAILGNVELILFELPESSPHKDNLEEIKTTCYSAAELCQQLLAFSGKGRFVIESLDISRVVDGIRNLLSLTISKNISLEFALAEELPMIEADVIQVRQVVINLVTNASEAMADRSGSISVRTGSLVCDREYLESDLSGDKLPTGNYVYLEISDQGSGMPEATVKKIFDPFFTNKFVGRGLGLAAVMGIVRGHKGAIIVRSEAGKGTTFQILFPTREGSRKNLPEALSKPVKSWQAKGLALVVDDEEIIRKLTSRMLERMGFQVRCANDGREALALYRELASEVVLVLLDLSMPHMGGIETFKKIKEIDDEVRVILASGYSEYEIAYKNTGQGFMGFLQKPFSYQELKNKVLEVL